MTAVTSWVNAVNGPSFTRYSKYDIFGNVVRAAVSCCQSKNFNIKPREEGRLHFVDI